MIYVFDLDNTLCKTTDSQYVDSVPYYDRIVKVNKLYDEGHTIIIETARGCISGKRWVYQTIDQLKSWGLKFHNVRAGVKFMADVYVDDLAINSEDFFNDKPKDKMSLESGSGVDTNIVIVNRVLKEATNERVDKLIDEIKFIESIPTEFKHKFPEIIFSKYSDDKAFYEMQHHNLPTIRRLILSGDMTSDEIVYWSDKITKFSLDLYNHERVDISKDVFFEVLHWNRFRTRMKELSSKSEWFKNILEEKEIEINGKTYKNLNVLFPSIKDRQKDFEPEFIGRWSHSDLHFSNILIDRDNDDFRLIDPRGYDFCDYYYDFGKLWHSVNGKYELISSRLFEVSGINESHHFNFDETSKPFQELHNAKDNLLDKLSVYSSDDLSTIEMKTEFNEVMHFSTLIPFLLDYDNKEERARTAYYNSVILMNDFCKKYGI